MAYGARIAPVTAGSGWTEPGRPVRPVPRFLGSLLRWRTRLAVAKGAHAPFYAGAAAVNSPPTPPDSLKVSDAAGLAVELRSVSQVTMSSWGVNE
jgi:hypothetical protein